jgi:hypothetical protein
MQTFLRLYAAAAISLSLGLLGFTDIVRSQPTNPSSTSTKSQTAGSALTDQERDRVARLRTCLKALEEECKSKTDRHCIAGITNVQQACSAVDR